MREKCEHRSLFSVVHMHSSGELCYAEDGRAGSADQHGTVFIPANGELFAAAIDVPVQYIKELFSQRNFLLYHKPALMSSLIWPIEKNFQAYGTSGASSGKASQESSTYSE